MWTRGIEIRMWGIFGIWKLYWVSCLKKVHEFLFSFCTFTFHFRYDVRIKIITIYLFKFVAIIIFEWKLKVTRWFGFLFPFPEQIFVFVVVLFCISSRNCTTVWVLISCTGPCSKVLVTSLALWVVLEPSRSRAWWVVCVSLRRMSLTGIMGFWDLLSLWLPSYEVSSFPSYALTMIWCGHHNKQEGQSVLHWHLQNCDPKKHFFLLFFSDVCWADGKPTKTRGIRLDSDNSSFPNDEKNEKVLFSRLHMTASGYSWIISWCYQIPLMLFHKMIRQICATQQSCSYYYQKASQTQDQFLLFEISQISKQLDLHYRLAVFFLKLKLL
jgi:hypothetical protein